MVDGMVSIITPCYNGERFIPETIESVLRQTYPNWEMIVVDDGSTDGTAKVAESYAARDGRIQVVRQSNGGTASARNNAMRRARGRYVALLDADDVWDANFLERQLAFMKAKDAACVCCAYRHIDENSREIQHPTVPMPVIKLRDMAVMNHVGCLTGLYDAKPHGKVFLHEELKSIRDDYAYWYEIIEKTGVAFGNPEILASYRVLSGSTTGNKLALVSKQYRFYRGFLKLGIVKSLTNIVRWGVRGLGKFS